MIHLTVIPQLALECDDLIFNPRSNTGSVTLDKLLDFSKVHFLPHQET